MLCSRASCATLRRRLANSGVGPSGRFSCSVSAARNSFIVLSESGFTSVRANSITDPLTGGEEGGHLFLEYLSGAPDTLENPQGHKLPTSCVPFSAGFVGSGADSRARGSRRGVVGFDGGAPGFATEISR